MYAMAVRGPCCLSRTSESSGESLVCSYRTCAGWCSSAKPETHISHSAVCWDGNFRFCFSEILCSRFGRCLHAMGNVRMRAKIRCAVEL